MLSDAGLANRGTPEHKTEAKQIKTKRRAIICLLLLAYIIVANIGYNLWTEGESIPVWKLLTADIIRDLWTTRKITATQDGTIVGILYSEENSCVLINRELVYEGDISNGVKVVKIDRCEVEFERNGKKWTQKVLDNPNPAWKATKQSTG
jgi:hypothetical protein